MAGLLGEYAKGLLGFVSDPQSWKDMGRNAVGLLGSPLPTQDEAAANLQRLRFRGSVMRDYPSRETDLAKSYNEKMINLAMGLNPVLATVWHGSPHLFPPTKNNPLGEFDLSKVGTGEGAQAFGHGTYLTESRDLGKVYKRKLTAPDGAPVQKPDQSIQISIGRLQNQIDQLKASGDPNAQAMIRAYQNRINELDANGYLYKVDLPDDQIARMLDWDKPLSQQPAARAAFEKAFKDYADIFAKTGPQRNEFKDAMIALQNGQMTGEGAYKSLARIIGDKTDAPTVSNTLMREYGIPGIRYLDGGSRGAGQGTSNFVVFDDKIPKILGRE